MNCLPLKHCTGETDARYKLHTTQTQLLTPDHVQNFSVFLSPTRRILGMSLKIT